MDRCSSVLPPTYLPLQILDDMHIDYLFFRFSVSSFVSQLCIDPSVNIFDHILSVSICLPSGLRASSQQDPLS